MLSLVLDARSDESLADESLDDSLGDELAEGVVVGGTDELETFGFSLGVSLDGDVRHESIWEGLGSKIRRARRGWKTEAGSM